ncbi:MAG: nucleotidyl transferase AbiEii/AbiGii toxin family protein [Candidatus Aenigmarchaeota archaeon]|nr:nucleotidyl transferase AbiEii/AbiGii toxin family protein [Candidatus Aenigmarchaeota archaeon]
MINLDRQLKLFKLMAEQCKKKVEVLVIGGSAMLFYNFSKKATKDIDLVALFENERKYLASVLERAGFRQTFVPGKENEREPCRLEMGEYVVDIFDGKVFRLTISQGMLDRIREKIEFGSLTVSVISPEDIIISKCMTDRPGDRQDAASIINEINVNWDIIIKECRWQSEHGDFRFSLYLHDFLDDLVHDFHIDVPEKTLKETRSMCREFMERLGKK